MVEECEGAAGVDIFACVLLTGDLKTLLLKPFKLLLGNVEKLKGSGYRR